MSAKVKESRSTQTNDLKIESRHRAKQAFVYIRQSTLQQVAGNQESTQLQYNLTQRAQVLGWSNEQITVIDEDQGKSGREAENRSGFQKLLTEISLDKVGIIIGIEMSRLARSCKDWYQLLELCGMFGCLLADSDGIYDPSLYNDRLLLGLKGTMSEAEIHVIRARLLSGKMNKAKRGELFCHVPLGYIRSNAGQVELDPDEQVCTVVRLIFAKFSELRSINSLLQFLSKQKILLGMRLSSRDKKNELVWKRPSNSTLADILHNPFYAGAYAYGRSTIDARKKIPNKQYSGERQVPLDDWKVLIQNILPAYISWDEYLSNQIQIKGNATRYGVKGVVREGKALLHGLLICCECGNKLDLQYSKGGFVQYVCHRNHAAYGAPYCQSFSGQKIDEVVSDAILKALAPSSIELCMSLQENSERANEAIEKNWKYKIERAKFVVTRAERQFQMVEPENRLVARSLEKQWENALVEEKSILEEYNRHKAGIKFLSIEDIDLIKRLSLELPLVWNSNSTTNRDRQIIVRSLIDKINVQTHGKTDLAEIDIFWKGGSNSSYQFSHKVRSYRKRHDFDLIVARITLLREEGYERKEIAAILNREGFRPAKNAALFNAHTVTGIIQVAGIPNLKNCHDSVQKHLKPKEWAFGKLAVELKMPYQTLYAWLKKGWLKSRQLEDKRNHWVVWADATEIQRLKALYLSHPQNKWAGNYEENYST